MSLFHRKQQEMNKKVPNQTSKQQPPPPPNNLNDSGLFYLFATRGALLHLFCFD